MTRLHPTRLWPVAVALALSPLSSCSCGPTCGPGTELVNNSCEPVPVDGIVCGAGTVQQGTECVLANAPIVCGAGTVEQGGACVPQNPLVCGAGTIAQNGQCVPDGPLTCGTGTTVINGECRPDVTCGAGTQAQGGVCLPVGAFTPEPASAGVTLPFDAAPSPDGALIYYTALGSDGATHSLWVAPFDGSAPPTELTTGFTAPLGVIVATDGDTVFVGDSGDENAADENDSGAIYSVDAASGVATRIAATTGFGVKGLDLVDNAGTDEITFSGVDPVDGVAGLFKLVGTTVTLVAKGAPFSDPSGVAVAATGDRYVVDSTAGTDGNATVIRVTAANAASVFLPNVPMRTGYPAGCALSLDQASLFVSGLAADNSALVYAIDIATQNVTTVNDGLQGNDEAGGLHRAQDSDSFAWSGATTVYAITFR